jgi:hypothetical protein
VQVNALPPALRERLGSEGTGGLLHVLDVAEREWSDKVLTLAGERFERRLAENASSLRVQISQSEGAVRADMGKLEVRLVEQLSQMEVRVLREIAIGRVDTIKWSFLFWVGQVVAISAVMGTMLRMIR